MPPKKKKEKKEKKPSYLPYNHSLFKKGIPHSEHLENIRFGEIDITFLILVLILLVFGVIMMYSASYAWAIKDNVAPDYYFKRQLFMAGVGLAIMMVVSSRLFDYHLLTNNTINKAFFAFCSVLMLVVHIPGVGTATADAKRWIDLKVFSFQPSELMKLALIILLAHIMAINYRQMNNRYSVILYLIPTGFVALLTLAQRHLSATIIVCIIAFSMMFIGGINLRSFFSTLFVGILIATIGILILYQTDKFDYLQERIASWLYTFEPENKDVAWQTRNSLIAIGSGNLFGLGLGNSRQKFLYLPESKNDFVFSIVCEELGFIGASVVIILFILLIFKGFSIAANAPDKFGMLLSAGIIIQIGLQALLNIAVVTNTIPNTGISLPFFSYGGTALIIQLAQMGIILNVSRQSIPSKEREDADDAAVSRAKKELGETARKRMSR